MAASDIPGLSLSQASSLGGANQNDPYILARAGGSSFSPGGFTSTFKDTAQNVGAGLSSITDKIGGAVSGLAGGLAGALDPSKLRAQAAGLIGGAAGGLLGGGKSGSPVPVNYAQSGKSAAMTDSAIDWRVRVSLFSGTDFLYNDANNSLLSPVKATDGVIFPITPTIQMTHTAKYNSSSLTHSNYAMQFYEGSEVGEIQLNGEFPIQSIDEGRYLLAAIYFFRSATKMFWGEDNRAGTPPPMVKLSGYGSHYFPNVPCVVKSFSHTMPEDKDYIEVWTPDGATSTRLPTQSTIQVTLQPIYSRAAVAQFKLGDFASGKLLGKGFV
jgi:hypothetical protein